MNNTNLGICYEILWKDCYRSSAGIRHRHTGAGWGATISKSARKEMLMKQKACKKEASEQSFGVHVMKKRAFIKACMSRV